MGRREDLVEKTRQRVIDAARELFSSSGIHRVSVDEVARRAGVARATVYYQFNSRVELLYAVVAQAAERGGAERLPEFRADPDPLHALRWYITGVASFWSSEYALFRNFLGLAAIDPDVSAVADDYDERRRKIVAAVVEALAASRQLRDGLSRRRARDIIWLVSSFNSFDQLRRGSKLSLRATTATMLDLASHVLAEPDAITRG